MKIRPLGAEFFHRETSERTDIAKLTVAFRTFVNAPKKGFGRQITGSIKVGLLQ
jgi:hypothetical protein